VCSALSFGGMREGAHPRSGEYQRASAGRDGV
jgi:hypothetical protein